VGKSQFLLVVVVGVSLALGCSNKCSGSYNCPRSQTDTTISTPLQLVAVWADPPCTASLVGADAGGNEVLVQFDGGATRAQTVTCHLGGRTRDHVEVSADVIFTSVDECCLVYSATNGVFVPADAGASGP